MAVTRDAILEVLRTIPDPEMPISIVDLGIVESVRIFADAAGESGDRVEISILPTFVGCPALDMIRSEIMDKVSSLREVGEVGVEFVYEPAWTIDRISEAGRTSLRTHGVMVPDRGSNSEALHRPPGGCASEGRATTMLRTSAIACPFCGSSETRMDSPFGPTRCRSIYYCETCRNQFETMKRV